MIIWKEDMKVWKIVKMIWTRVELELSEYNHYS